MDDGRPAPRGTPNAGQRRSLLVLLAVVVVVLAAWWLRHDDARLAPAAAATPSAPATPARADSSLAPAVAPAREAAPEQPAADAEPELAHVRGRCVDDDGAPLAGCVAKLDGRARTSDAAALEGGTDGLNPTPRTTGADGRFDFAFAPRGGLQWALDVQREGRVPRTGRWDRIEPRQVIDLGDVRMARGHVVRGRVLDQHGAPVEQVGVALLGLPLPITDGSANDSCFGWSAPDGTFQVQAAIPTGRWPVQAQARGVRHVSPMQLEVGADGAAPMLVTVQRLPAIAGLVVDDLGRPVAGVGIQTPRNAAGRFASARSRTDGTFTLFAVEDAPAPTRLHVADPGPCEPPEVPDERTWPWGSRDVRIELPRALTCELTVVERGSGAPVTRFAVRCRNVRADAAMQQLRHAGVHEHGRASIERVWRGENVLQVVPLDPALLPSEPTTFVATEHGAPALRVELERMHQATLRVVRSDGTPIGGSTVQVVAKGTSRFDASSGTSPVQEPTFVGENGWRPHVRLSAAKTAADGSAAVFAPAAQDRLAVLATGEHLPTIVDPVALAPGGELRIVVRAGGGIAGVVHVQGLDATSLRVDALDTILGNSATSGAGTEVREDGAFELTTLPPGRYRLQLAYHTTFQQGGVRNPYAVPTGIAPVEVDVAEGTQARVSIDATALVPARVRGRALLDGAVAAEARVHFLNELGGAFGQYLVGADGTFASDDLLPGTYRAVLSVRAPHADGGPQIRGDALVLAAGQQLDTVLAFVRRRLVITLLRPDGSAAANVACELRGEQFQSAPTTDTRGQLVLDPAPPGRLLLQVGQQQFGNVQVPDGRTLHEVTLTLGQ